MSYEGGFHLIQGDADTAMLPLPISGTAYTKGDCLELVDGIATWAAVTSSSNARTRKAVVQETVTSSATEVKAILVTPSQVWVMESANNSASADRGDRMAFTDGNTVNNSGSDQTGATGCFQQLTESGAAADKRIVGQFCGLYGNATV